MRLLRIALVAFILLNAGCGGLIYINVETFHELNSSLSPKSYAFLATSDQKISLEYKIYQNLIRKKLEKFGYQEVEPSNADLQISFNYSISSPQEKVGSSPVYGQTGIKSSTTSRPSMYGTYSSTTYTPTYGVVGSQTYTYTTYTRRLGLVLLEGRLVGDSIGKRLYEGTAKSTGPSGSLSTVMPYLVEALFKEFPGESGKAHKVILSQGSIPSSQ